MNGITLEKGKTIYESGQPLTTLHLITNGKVIVSYPGGSYQLGKGDVIGVCEICFEVHYLKYTVTEETSIVTYPFANIAELNNLLDNHPDVARLFILSAFRQINSILEYCSVSELNCSSLYQSLTEDYEKYNTLCKRYRLQPRTLEQWDLLAAYLGDESPDFWVSDYYLGLTRIYSSETYKLLVQDSAVSCGILRKCCLDFRKAFSSLEEQYRYLQQINDYYFNESGNDLFDFYTSLYYKLGPNCEESEELFSDINRMIWTYSQDSNVDSTILDMRIKTFQDNITMLQAPAADTADTDTAVVSISELVGSLNTILEFADAGSEVTASFRQHVQAYKALEDKFSTEDECNALRAALTREFHELYAAIFKKSLQAAELPVPVRMFLYFGYVDEDLAGSKNAAILYRLADTMTSHADHGVYTFYDWLLAIYHGKKEPSRNEFDQDYNDFIHSKKLSGNLSDAERKALETNSMAKVDFELENMFPSVNKITYGRISIYCPLFISENVLKDLESTYVTVSIISKAFEQIRKVDYSAFYRESFDLENSNLLGKETVHFEFLPDVILMPNVGIRGSMWQEIEGKRRNTPGRMLFSIFHLEDINMTITRLTGEFRWELCKRVQGSRWNDVSDPSLTSEYFDYIQFYRKNHDLTSEAKERVRSSLQRAKNSFKEMFVRDYMVWVMFEGNGSPRLNKVARKILFTYCPFPKSINDTIRQNPLYAELFTRYDLVTAQKLHKLDVLIKKLRNSGQKVPDSLIQEQDYVAGTVHNTN
ncbi:MAG: hypothetical protein K6G30_10080 [Acetatifactor sp.]|nr:hypothetical protein [Acetatifactor sp.]